MVAPRISAIHVIGAAIAFPGAARVIAPTLCVAPGLLPLSAKLVQLEMERISAVFERSKKIA